MSREEQPRARADWRQSDKALLLHFLKDVAGFGGRKSILAVFLAILAALTEGVGIFMLIPILDAFSNTGKVTSGVSGVVIDALARFAGMAGVDPLPLALFVFAFAIVARAMIVGARKIVVTQLQIDYFRGKQLDLTRSLAYAPWQNIVGMRHARVTQLLSHDLNRVGMVAIGLISLIVAGLTMAILFGLALVLAPGIAMIAVGMGLVTGLISRPLVKQARTLGASVTATNLKLLNDVGQFLAALKMCVSQNLQDKFVASFAADLATAGDEEIRFVRAECRVRLINTVVIVLAGVGTALLSISILKASPAVLMTVLVILSRLAGPADTIFNQGTMMVRAFPAYREMLELESDLGNSKANQQLWAYPNSVGIEFDRCTYRHSPSASGGGRESRGISNVSLTIPRGSFFGITGPSGAGKTTFLDLLVGLYAPDSGVIRIDGVAADLTTAPQWRERLAYVPQDPFLRNGTVLENLMFGARRTPPVDEIERALEISGADTVIAHLKDGLSTVLGERGALISGGERQRIAIAASLLRNPDLLILDEATNAIDIEAEARLIDRLDRLRPDLTIVIVAHRIQSLARCDTVAVLTNGTVVQCSGVSWLGKAEGMNDLRTSVIP